VLKDEELGAGRTDIAGHMNGLRKGGDETEGDGKKETRKNQKAG